MKRNIIKITSFILVLSLISALFTVFPMADGTADTGAKVIYNRGYEEGWSYSNGLNTDLKSELDVELVYNKISASKYDYYMKLQPMSDAGGYLNLDLGKDTPTAGKLFFEMDLLATAGNNMGGIILIAGMGEGTDRGLSHIVSFSNGRIYLLGEDAGSVPTSWANLSFVFDFDYAKNNAANGAAANEYLITVSYGEKSFSRVMTAKAGFGIADIYIGAQENLFGYDREGDIYYLDDVKVYYNVNEKTELDPKDFGSAVDTGAKYDEKIEGLGGGGSYVSGQLPFGSDVLPYERVSDTDEENPVHVYYHRHFGEGWGYSNGFKSNAERDNDFFIANDYAAEVNAGSGLKNYFLQMVQRNSQNGFVRIDTSGIGMPQTGTIYIEFDIKASAGAHIGGTMSYLSPSAKLEFNMVSIQNGDLYVLGHNFGSIGDAWCHVAIAVEFGPYIWEDVDEEGNRLYNPDIIFTAYVGAEGKTTTLVKPLPDDRSAKKGLYQLRIGRGGTLAPENEGDWWGLDNLVVYSSAAGYTPDEDGVVDHRRGFADIASDNFGVKGSTLINADATKDFAIDTGSEPSITDIMNSSLSMKVNSNNALLFGEKIRLFTDENGNYYGAPYKENGIVMVPVDAVLRYVNAPHEYSSGGMSLDIFTGGEYKALAIGRDSVEIAGKVYKLSAAPVIKTFDSNKLFYIALDDVELLFPGYYVTWDDTGFMSIAEYDNFFDRMVNEEYLQQVMWSFVFDIAEVTTEELYAMAKENTNNFDHPYIYAKQDTFDRLYNVYHSSPADEIFDQTLIEYLDISVSHADDVLKRYAVFDKAGNYIGIKEGQWKANSEGMVSWDTSQTTGNHSIAVMPYQDSNGYDPSGGRLNVLSDGEGCLAMAAEKAAFAYQVTKDEKYARFAYDWIWALCQWEHWGPGHFLNCANSSRPMAVAFDWLYDGWSELAKEDEHFDVAYLAKRIYENGVYEGWRVVNGLPCEHLGRPGGGDSSKWINHIGNWNPVCCLGMTVASLAVMGYDEYGMIAAENAVKSLQAMGARGFTYIGFDGSYRESAGYWAATSRMTLQLIETCNVAFGTDFNFALNPGLNITDYYGCHVESNEYIRWNYHDDWVGTTNKYWYYLSAKVYGDPAFAALRNQQISNSEAMEPLRYDCLYYDKATIEDGKSALALDFAMDSIDGYLTRAAWEPGALWAGILGGKNNVAHGQYDSGNWVYEEGGIRWFFDLGADDYNLYGGGLGSGYYRYSTLGNNVLALGSKQDTIPHGQVLTEGGELISNYSNEYGSAAVLDMSSVYGGANNVTYARRGMLLTNDRKTLVIQDEVSMVLIEDLYWFAHFDTNVIKDYSISSDGRTFLMHSAPDRATGKRMTVRVNLVTANRGFKFEVWDASTETEGQFVFDATPRAGYSMSMKGIDEDSRDHIKKLVIAGVNTLTFEVGVVIEMIDEENPVELGYTLGWEGNPRALPPMQEWIPMPDTRTGVDNSVLEDNTDVALRPNPALSTIIGAENRLSGIIEKGAYLGADRESFFRALTDIEYAILKRNGRNNTSEVIVAAIAAYDEAKAKYDKFQGKIDKDAASAADIASGLIGLSKPKTEDTPAPTE